jgi:hypothetical protein
MSAGDHARALIIYQDALRSAHEPHQTNDVAHALEGLGECRLREGDTETALTHLKKSHAIFQRIALTPDAYRVSTRLTQNTT